MPRSKLIDVKSPVNGAVLIGSALLLIALIAAGIRQANPTWVKYSGSTDVTIITPELTGQPEACLTCHAGIEEISAAHPVDAFGCVSCHGGDRLALDKDAAHTGLIGGRNPSDLSVVEQSCGGGDCHGGSPEDARDHIARVERSIQSTYAGAINHVLFSFNVTGENDTHYGITAVTDDIVVSPDAATALVTFDPAAFNNPIVTTFSETCLTCHLRAEPIMEPYYYRGTGCAACHVPYNADGLYKGRDLTIDRDEPGHPAEHRLTTQIPYTTCNACHNRGNYSLAQMRVIPRDDLPAPADLPFHPDDARLAQYYQPIGQYTLCEWELDCIDCHTTNEAMGDGDLHLSQSSAQKTQCQTCHGTLTTASQFVTITEIDDPAIRRAQLNPHYDVQVGTQVMLAPDGDTIGSVQLIDEQVIQIGKVTGLEYVVPPVMGTQCEQQPDQQESLYCHECHAFEK